MKKRTIFIITLFISFNAISWGLTGHRIVGQIAQKHLSNKTKKEIKRVFGHQSLAYNAN